MLFSRDAFEALELEAKDLPMALREILHQEQLIAQLGCSIKHKSDRRYDLNQDMYEYGGDYEFDDETPDPRDQLTNEIEDLMAAQEARRTRMQVMIEALSPADRVIYDLFVEHANDEARYRAECRAERRAFGGWCDG